MRRPRIRKSQERELIARYQAGDLAAGADLIAQYRDFIFNKACIISHYPRHDLTVEDLCQEGAIGLLEAARRFDFSRENRFLTYASWWIRHHMDRATHDVGSTIGIPTYVHGILGQAHRGAIEEREEHRAARAILSMLSLDAQICTGPGILSMAGESCDDKTFLDIIPGDAPTPEDLTAAAEQDAVKREAVAHGLAHLTERERFIIHHRYLAEETETLASIGARLGFSREYARQIEARALRKLKEVGELQAVA